MINSFGLIILYGHELEARASGELCVAYFAQTFCQDSSLWFFEQHLEASKAKAFAGETKGKSSGKSGKETFFT